jgi:hypothetical protein
MREKTGHNLNTDSNTHTITPSSPASSNHNIMVSPVSPSFIFFSQPGEVFGHVSALLLRQLSEETESPEEELADSTDARDVLRHKGQACFYEVRGGFDVLIFGSEFSCAQKKP